MRENRPYGSEGGAARKGRLYPYPGRSELELAETSLLGDNFTPIP